MKIKKYLSVFLGIALLATALSGCANNQPKAVETAKQVSTDTKEVEKSSQNDGKTVTTFDGKTIDVSNVTLRIAAASGANGQAVIEAAGLDDTPYKVEFSVLQGGNKVMEALAANQIDLGAGSQIPPLSASLASNGGNFKVIAVRYGSTLQQELIAAPGSEIKSVDELKGKKVGYVKNTTAHYFLSKMLTNAGLTWNDIEALPLSTSDGATAIVSGDIDAWASYDNSIRVPKEKGATTIESAQNILSGNYLFYASIQAIDDEAYHAAIEDWLHRWHEAHQWARENSKEWAEYYAPTINQSVEEYLTQFEEQNTDKFFACKPITDAVVADEQDIADTFESLGVFEQHIDTEKFFDFSFSNAVSNFPKYD